MKKLIVLFLFSSTAMAESYNLLCKNNIDKSLVDVYISYSVSQAEYGRMAYDIYKSKISIATMFSDIIKKQKILKGIPIRW